VPDTTDSTPPAAVADGRDHQLDQRWIPLQRITGLVTAAVMAAASFVGAISLWAASGILALGLLILPLWVTAVALLAWQLWRWPAIAYRFMSYRIDDLGIEIREGVYWRTIVNVPRSRVQHTDVSQGPLERRYGLATLVVYTAGTAHSRVSLGGLAHDVARDIRAHLLPGGDSDAV
jgi:membrane protein YdbS with pleckstrin-like domain